MFKSWDDIEQKFEVFLFMCGIMEDPSPAIDHMCEQYVRDLTALRSFYQYTDLLFKIIKEIRSKRNILNHFCNEHFYHVWQLPLKQQSRMYIFGENLDWLQIGSNATTTHVGDTRISSCHVLIKNTCLPPHDVLKAISTLRQTISFLSIEEPFVLRDEACDNIPDHIFKIDPLATSIHIRGNVVLPKAISKDLGREISTCYNLSDLRIPNKTFCFSGNN